MNEWVGGIVRMVLTRDNRSTQGETCPSPLCPPLVEGMRLNPGLRDERPGPNTYHKTIPKEGLNFFGRGGGGWLLIVQ